MTCSRVAADLQLYIDGRLDPRRLGALEAHLMACAACRQELRMLQTIAQACAEPDLATVPVGLTTLIMARIAQAETQRARAASGVFVLRWGDGVLAAFLATASTLLLVLLDPAFRVSVANQLLHAFPSLPTLLGTPGPGSIAWVAWVVWVVTGLLLALALAGAEVRATMRRSLGERMAQLPHPPQIPQLRHL